MKLVLVYTLKCNAVCQICCFNCEPKQDEKIDFEVAKHAIRQAADTKVFEEISITGGEALLYKDEVKNLIMLSHSYHFKTTLTTNASWAKSIEEAYRVLSELKEKGLTLLLISTDEFHLPFIPSQNIENLIIANEKLKMPLIFQSITTKKTAAQHPLEIKYPEHIWKKGVCQPVGRATETIPEEDYIYSEWDGKCIYANTLTIMPDGYCYPCCSQGLRLENLKIGSIHEQTLEELILAKQRHEYTKIIIHKGPSWLKKAGELQGHYLADSKQNYVSLCHLCHEIAKDQVYLEKMKDIIKKTAYQISYSQLLRLKSDDQLHHE